jgi:acyl-CoA thioesterase FadM
MPARAVASLSGSERLPGNGTILAHAECDYLAPVVNERSTRVKADHVGRSSFTLVYDVVNATMGQIAKARTVIVAFDYQAKKPVPILPEGRAFLARIGGQV